MAGCPEGTEGENDEGENGEGGGGSKGGGDSSGSDSNSTKVFLKCCERQSSSKEQEDHEISKGKKGVMGSKKVKRNTRFTKREKVATTTSSTPVKKRFKRS